MSEFKLRFATDELERAQREAENCRLAWKIARAASPTDVALDEMEAYCMAADYAATAMTAYERAQMECQAEWAERESIVRRAEVGSSVAGTPAFARRAIAEAPATLNAGAVVRISSRED